jgi:hypothetical protein
MHALLSTGHVRAIQQFLMNLLNIEYHKNPSAFLELLHGNRQTDGQKDGVILIGTAQQRQQACQLGVQVQHSEFFLCRK